MEIYPTYPKMERILGEHDSKFKTEVRIKMSNGKYYRVILEQWAGHVHEPKETLIDKHLVWLDLFNYQVYKFVMTYQFKDVKELPSHLFCSEDPNQESEEVRLNKLYKENSNN